jgi:hypothetical protein
MKEAEDYKSLLGRMSTTTSEESADTEFGKQNLTLPQSINFTIAPKPAGTVSNSLKQKYENEVYFQENITELLPE